MDDYDDLQVEEFSNFDFVEEMNEPDKFKFDEYLNSNIDY